VDFGRFAVRRQIEKGFNGIAEGSLLVRMPAMKEPEQDRRAPSPARHEVKQEDTEECGVKLQVSRRELEAVRGQEAVVMKWQPPEPEVVNGESFPFRVDKVRVLDDLRIESLGESVLCRTEEEAVREGDRLWKEQMSKPQSCEVLDWKNITAGQHLTITMFPITQLLTIKEKSKGGGEPWAQENFKEIMQVSFVSQAGTGQLGLSFATDFGRFTEVYRVVNYVKAVPVFGVAHFFGVERAELDEMQVPMRLLERNLFQTEEEAKSVFKRACENIPWVAAERAGASAEKIQALRAEAEQIRAIQAFVDKAHHPVAKARHQERILKIIRERAEKEAREIAAKAAEAKRNDEMTRANSILMKELFPDLYKVKERWGGVAAKDMSKYLDEMRKGLAIDCRRLGMGDPFGGLPSDHDFVSRLVSAHKAKSPVKAAQIEAVLNSRAKGYENMPEEEWTLAVERVVGEGVSRGGLARTISEKFGLRSNLKGRPESK
jgi:hypothetical protein